MARRQCISVRDDDVQTSSIPGVNQGRALIMEKKKTSPLVYVALIAAILALGVFIVQRLRHNAEDQRQINKVLNQ
jgi:hypothetical protein